MPRRRSSRRNEGTFDYNFDEVVGANFVGKNCGGPIRRRPSRRPRPERLAPHPAARDITSTRQRFVSHASYPSTRRRSPRARPSHRRRPRASDPERQKQPPPVAKSQQRRQISRTTWPPHAATSSWTSRPSRRRSGPMRRSSRSPPPGTVRSFSPRPLTISPPIAHRSVGRSIDRAFPAPETDPAPPRPHTQAPSPPSSSATSRTRT